MLISRPAPRRLLVAAATLGLAAASLTAVASSAAAADPTNLYVVGTSDVSDSNLMQSVIIPGFQADYPQYAVQYSGSGSGQAIANAQAGLGAALIVHAPTLENQFVKDGYSEESAGRALFWGDYVLLGPDGDPAHVMADGSTNIIQAFQDIAAAGKDGKAQFISRGGNPGTTVQEHQIWAQTTGVTTCSVDNANFDGGGAAPTTDPQGTSCTPTTQHPPSWYHVTGDKQAANVLDANACTYNTGETDDCYVLTDRGTYDYLTRTGSATPPSKLKVVTRNNTTSAQTPTGQFLVNTFHGYVVNPDSVPANSKTDVTGATDFLNWITSPKGQAAINSYVPNTTDTAPFKKDAAPTVSVSTPPSTVTPPKELTVSGTLKNEVPGTPALSNVEVRLYGVPVASPAANRTEVGLTTTNAAGKFTISLIPKINMTYSVDTATIAKTEYTYAAGVPDFTDVLQPTSNTPVGTVDVQGVVSNVVGKGGKSQIDVRATTLPIHYGATSTLTLLARRAGSTAAFTSYGTKTLKAGANTIHQTYTLPKGTWRYYLRYSNPGYILTGSTKSQGATVS